MRILVALSVLLVSMFVAGCLSFQTRDNPLKLTSARTVLVGPKSWRIHFREEGQKGRPVVVMIHGYGSASVVWVPLMRILARAGYHCVALDLPGFGLSDKRPGNYQTTHIASMVAAFLRKKGITRADVIAHSWGSSVALALTLQQPQLVRRLVLNSAWVYSAQIVPAIRWAKVPLFGTLMYGLFYREMPGEKLAHAVYDARRFATQPVVEAIKRSHDRPGALAAALAVARGMDFQAIEARYQTIRQKTLLQWGRQDRIALPFYGRRLVAHLPNARLVFLERCGHMPMLERPHAFARHIRQFLGPWQRQQRAKRRLSQARRQVANRQINQARHTTSLARRPDTKGAP